MPATVNILSQHGNAYSGTSAISTSNVAGSSIRFKLADNDTVDSNNPVAIPASGTNYSWLKQLRFSVPDLGGSSQLNNLRFYTSGSFGTGVGLNVNSFAPIAGTAASSGSNSTTTMVCNPSQTWATNAFVGYLVEITAGTASTNSQSIQRITSNDASTLTVASSFSTTPHSDSVFRIVYFDPITNAATALSTSPTSPAQSHGSALSYTSGSTLSVAGSTTSTGSFGSVLQFQLSVGSTANSGSTGSVTLTFVYDET